MASDTVLVATAIYLNSRATASDIIKPVLSSRPRHTGWQTPIDPNPMLSGFLIARTGV